MKLQHRKAPTRIAATHPLTIQANTNIIMAEIANVPACSSDILFGAFAFSGSVNIFGLQQFGIFGLLSSFVG